MIRLPQGRRPRGAGAGRVRYRTSTGGTRHAVGRNRVRAVVLAFAVAGLLLCGRAVQVSLSEDERFLALAAEQTPVEALGGQGARGSIISADGRELARSLDTVQIVASPDQVHDPAAAARSLSAIIGGSADVNTPDIKAALAARDAKGRPGRHSVVGTVDPATAGKVADLGIEGVYLVPSTERVYPDGRLASQALGHVGDYGEVFGGVEARHDETLSAGEDVRLTLDTAVQQELQEALGDATREHGAKSALGVVMRADDGAIVALANAPGYDNNLFSKSPAEMQRDRVLTDPYEPGSTFKPFTVAAALEEGTIAEATTFTVPDSIPVADRIIHDSMPHATEVMDTAKILAESSNVGTIQIAQSLGGESLSGYISRFGFGGETGVDLWGESAGEVPVYEDWSGSSIGNIPMGQGLTVTPLQLAAGYATLANGGLSVTPHVTEGGARTGHRVISAGTSDIVRGMLQGVVESGTGHLARIPGYSVAGKTGTSQKVDPETGTYGDEYVSSFVGFAPAGDPEFVVLIAVDEPRDTIWGETVAAPAFKKVMGFALGYYNVPPDETATPQEEAG